MFNNACVACSAGTENGAGDDASLINTTCDPILCDEDERVSNNHCVACVSGTINEVGDDASQEDTTCDPILCEVNERVFNHKCLPCEPGTSNQAGDDASQEDTSCEGGGEAATTTCRELETCLRGCGNRNPPCSNACRAASDDDSRQLLSRLQSCIDANCAEASDEESCVRERCVRQSEECTNDR